MLPMAPLVVLGLLSHQRPEPAAVHALPSSDTGNVTLTNSLGGGAVFTASGMAPGKAASGTVTIGNSGDTPASLKLAQSAPDDTLGVGGGRLSGVLTLRVTDETDQRTVYAGPLGAIGTADAGTVAPGSGHVYRFTMRMDDVANSRPYQGASTTVRYDWTGTGVSSPPSGGSGTGGTGGGDTGGGGVTAPPADTRPPTITLTGKAKQRARSASLTARCDEPCTFSAKAKLAGAKGAKAPKARVAPVSAAAGEPAKVKLTFDKRSLKKIKRGKLTVTVTAVDAAGNRSSATKAIKLTR